VTPEVVAFIFARGGSVGVPRKNVREVGGKSLIGRAIESAQKAKRIDRVMVSTDDEEIAEVARQFGAEVPFIRPEHLARSDSAEINAWQHAAKYLQSDEFGSDSPEIFISVPTTSPLRSPDDLDRIVEEYQRGGVDIVLGVKESDHNPYWNMFVLDEDGVASLAIEPSQENPHPTTRQSAPVTYDITTVGYAVNLDYIIGASTLFEGTVRAVDIPIERAWDIDTEMDLEIADFLLRRMNE
jgi:CMP-N-acetylneuraminic acid synthetase